MKRQSKTMHPVAKRLGTERFHVVIDKYIMIFS